MTLCKYLTIIVIVGKFVLSPLNFYDKPHYIDKIIDHVEVKKFKTESGKYKHRYNPCPNIIPLPVSEKLNKIIKPDPTIDYKIRILKPQDVLSNRQKIELQKCSLQEQK